MGSMFLHAFHEILFILLGMCKFQMWRQNRPCSLLWDVSAEAESLVMVLATLYALLTVKRPLGVEAQIMWSFGLWRLREMLRMDVESSLKKTWLIRLDSTVHFLVP